MLQKGRMSMSVRHDWLDTRRDLDRKSQGRRRKRVSLRTRLSPGFVLFLSFSRPHIPSPLLVPFSSSLSAVPPLPRLMCCVCACWIAASKCTPEAPLGFPSCAATAAAPPRRSPSSPPRCRSSGLEGRRRKC